MDEDQRIIDALDIVYKYGDKKSKSWIIDQMVQALTGDGYEDWVNRYEYDATDENGNPARLWEVK